MNHDASTILPTIRLVVQLGFAGSRMLLDRNEFPDVDEEDFLARVQAHLGAVLRELPLKLGLTGRHFLCGVSQIAIGADTVFTRACGAQGIRQRIFLPQHRDAYFAAEDKNGTRDFTDSEVKIAKALLKEDHIIEDRLVSHSPERSERFEDVNLELVRVSDVLISLQRANADHKRGGTGDLIQRAAARHKPLLEITVSLQDGRPFFSEKWHANKPHGAAKDAPLLKPPGIPPVLRGCRIPDGGDYAKALKDFSSTQAEKHQGFFKWAALAIIGTHFLATVCAVTGLAFHGLCERVLPWLLGVEMVLLATGFTFHWRLHRSHSARQWAIARLVSEVARSVTAMSKVPGYLGHLFMLPLPESLRALLRTLNIFHLEVTRRLDPASWRERREAYVSHRLTHGKSGQIPYYRREYGKACRWLRVATIAFYTASALAFFATLWEFIIACSFRSLECPCALNEWLEHLGEFAEHAPVFLAMILPVLSVAAMSLAASFDLEARRHTYEEMIRALEKQKDFIEGAGSEREFADLVLQTETRLVGENVNWFSRRAFTGVA